MVETKTIATVPLQYNKADLEVKIGDFLRNERVAKDFWNDIDNTFTTASYIRDGISELLIKEQKRKIAEIDAKKRGTMLESMTAKEKRSVLTKLYQEREETAATFFKTVQTDLQQLFASMFQMQSSYEIKENYVLEQLIPQIKILYHTEEEIKLLRDTIMTQVNLFGTKYITDITTKGKANGNSTIGIVKNTVNLYFEKILQIPLVKASLSSTKYQITDEIKKRERKTEPIREQPKTDVETQIPTDYESIKKELAGLKKAAEQNVAKFERLSLLETILSRTTTIADYRGEIKTKDDIEGLTTALRGYKATKLAIDKLRTVAKEKLIINGVTAESYETAEPSALIGIIGQSIDKIKRQHADQRIAAEESFARVKATIIDIYAQNDAEKATLTSLDYEKLREEIKRKHSEETKKTKESVDKLTEKYDTLILTTAKYIGSMRAIAEALTDKKKTAKITAIKTMECEELTEYIRVVFAKTGENYNKNIEKMILLYHKLEEKTPEIAAQVLTDNKNLSIEKLIPAVTTIIDEYAANKIKYEEQETEQKAQEQMQRELGKTIDTLFEKTPVNYDRLVGKTLFDAVAAKVEELKKVYKKEKEETERNATTIQNLTTKVKAYEKLLDTNGTLQTAIEQALTPTAIVDYIYTALEQHSLGVYARDKSGKDAYAFVNAAYLAVLRGQTIPAADDIASGTDASLTDIIDGQQTTIVPALYLKDPVTREGCDGSVRVVFPQQFIDAVATAIKTKVINDYVTNVEQTEASLTPK